MRWWSFLDQTVAAPVSGAADLSSQDSSSPAAVWIAVAFVLLPLGWLILVIVMGTRRRHGSGAVDIRQPLPAAPAEVTDDSEYWRDWPGKYGDPDVPQAFVTRRPVRRRLTAVAGSDEFDLPKVRPVQRLRAEPSEPDTSPPKTDSRGHVFISYNRKDREYVEKLAKHLEAHGIRAWYDYDLVAGERFTSVIQERIDTCAAFIVIVTPEAMASRWVNLEMDHANAVNKPFFPLKLAASKPHIFLSGLHHEDATSGQLPTAAFITRLRQLTSRC